LSVKWKLEIEMKLLEKNGIRIEIEIFFKMEITLNSSGLQCKVAYWPALAVGSAAQLAAARCRKERTKHFTGKQPICSHIDEIMG